jgi:hypothetical protein
MRQTRFIHIVLLVFAVMTAVPGFAGREYLTILSNRTPLAHRNAYYHFQLYSTGGTAPYHWTVQGLEGSGLRAESDGLIVGVPKKIGSYNLTVTVEDASEQKAESLLELNVYGRAYSGAMNEHFFGLHAHNTSMDWPSVASDVNPFGTIRLWDVGVAWSDLETTENNIDWSRLDAFMEMARANGVGVLYEVAYTPTWASSDPDDHSCKEKPGSCDAPTDWQTFDDFMSALVSRYTSVGVQTGCNAAEPQCHGVIRNYELWDEPFVPREWNPAQKKYNYNKELTMQGFVTMTQDGKAIINKLDPNASVGSFSGSTDFFESYWKTQGSIKDFDSINLHAYPEHAHPVPESMVFPTMQVVELMRKYHIDKPLMNTEGSWSQWPPPTSDAQAAYASRYLLLQAGMKMKKSIWYMWTGLAALWNTTENPGILTAGGAGYEETATWLLGATISSAGCLHNGRFDPNIFDCNRLAGTYVMNVVRPGGYKGQIVWYVKIPSGTGVDWSAERTYKVSDGYTQYVDLSGDVYTVNNSEVTVGASPILLENMSMPGVHHHSYQGNNPNEGGVRWIQP